MIHQVKPSPVGPMVDRGTLEVYTELLLSHSVEPRSWLVVCTDLPTADRLTGLLRAADIRVGRLYGRDSLELNNYSDMLIYGEIDVLLVTKWLIYTGVFIRVPSDRNRRVGVASTVNLRLQDCVQLETRFRTTAGGVLQPHRIYPSFPS